MSQGNPPQRQSQPGRQHKMRPEPDIAGREHRGSGRLDGRIAIVTGGDSGIGRSVAVLFAAKALMSRSTTSRSTTTPRTPRAWSRTKGAAACWSPVMSATRPSAPTSYNRRSDEFGQLDVLVNNAAEQHVSDDIADISTEQLERTFRTNVFAMFHLVKAAAPHLGEGASIINSTSVTAYQGNPMLVDYSATKGAIVAFTRALSQQVIGRGIRVNAVAPGPI